jgi:hypothetical protein
MKWMKKIKINKNYFMKLIQICYIIKNISKILDKRIKKVPIYCVILSNCIREIENMKNWEIKFFKNYKYLIVILEIKMKLIHSFRKWWLFWMVIMIMVNNGKISSLNKKLGSKKRNDIIKLFSLFIFRYIISNSTKYSLEYFFIYKF